jgi:hypothetical protein
MGCAFSSAIDVAFVTLTAASLTSITVWTDFLRGS